MANRIIAPEPPNLPLAPLQYDRPYQDQHSNVLRLFFNRLVSALQTLFGVRGGQYLNTPYGAFQDSTDQADGALNVAYYLRFNTTDFTNGVALEPRTASVTASIGTGGVASTTMTVSAVTSGALYPSMQITGTGVTAGTYIVEQLTGTTGSTGTYRVSTSQLVASTTVTGTLASKIAVTQPGLYNFQFSIQIINSTNDSQSFYLWFRKNGTDIPNSASDFGIRPRKSTGDPSRSIAAMNFYVDMAANDYVEMMWHASDPGVSIESFPATSAGASTPAIPAVPSVILTVSFVSNVL